MVSVFWLFVICMFFVGSSCRWIEWLSCFEFLFFGVWIWRLLLSKLGCNRNWLLFFILKFVLGMVLLLMVIFIFIGVFIGLFRSSCIFRKLLIMIVLERLLKLVIGGVGLLAGCFFL